MCSLNTVSFMCTRMYLAQNMKKDLRVVSVNEKSLFNLFILINFIVALKV